MKKPLYVDPSFQLETSACYGSSETEKFYEVSSYILGQPFFKIEEISKIGLQ